MLVACAVPDAFRHQASDTEQSFGRAGRRRDGEQLQRLGGKDRPLLQGNGQMIKDMSVNSRSACRART